MARLGIDDHFWLEVISVIAKTGDQDKAVGNAIRWFRFAQEKHKHGRLVTEDEFAINGFLEHLFPIFATRVDGGIKCAGAEKHFGWLQQKKDAGRAGGKKSAKRPRDPKGRLTKTQAPPSEAIQANPSGHQASPSPSYSCINSSSQVAILEKSPNPVADYCDLWKAKNGKSPTITQKAAGQLTKFAKDVGHKRAVEIMRTYFSMPDPFFIKRGYDVSTMLLNVAAIEQFESNGKIVTKATVEQIEKQVDKIQGTKKRRSITELEAERENQLKLAAGGEHVDSDN